MKYRIGFLTVPLFSMEKSCGGAEAICLSIVKAFSANMECFVFCGEPDISKNLQAKKIANNITRITSFYIEDNIKNNGVIPSISVMQKYDLNLLISFERCVADIDLAQICVLGGISYKHCIDLASCSYWDRLIVPSKFVQVKCIDLNPNKAHNIEVIPNGIDTEQFYPTKNFKESNSILLPFRPDWGKGYRESIEFVSKLNNCSSKTFYLSVTKQDENVFSDIRFYESLSQIAFSMNVKIKYIPWVTTKNMNKLYNNSCFVLSIGTLEEGFGLTTIESLLAGTPVLARKIGATPHLIGENSGIVYYDENVSVSELVKAIFSFTFEELQLTQEYIKKRYSINKMIGSYTKVIKEFLNVDAR